MTPWPRTFSDLSLHGFLAGKCSCCTRWITWQPLWRLGCAHPCECYQSHSFQFWSSCWRNSSKSSCSQCRCSSWCLQVESPCKCRTSAQMIQWLRSSVHLCHPRALGWRHHVWYRTMLFFGQIPPFHWFLQWLSADPVWASVVAPVLVRGIEGGQCIPWWYQG